MRLFLIAFLCFVPTSLSFGFSKRQNVINFSVKGIESSNLNSIKILNKNWESIAKFVNFYGNSTKLTGNIRLSNSLEKVILKLDNNDIDQNEVLVSLKSKDISYTTVHTDSYKMKISASKQMIQKDVILHQNDSNGCECEHGNCACCVAISVPEFRHSVCVNATYNPVSIGLDLSIGVDGHYFSEEISLRNPPPICFSLPIPGAEHVAGVCVAFTKLDLDKKAKILAGCMDFEVELIHLRVLSFHLGCFRMPI
uniref:DUF4773 domain-containing protein n=1 Tax=Caenorhabditis tropicalis TaxID=1561998 RepID=A0A1I7UY22_9PELO